MLSLIHADVRAARAAVQGEAFLDGNGNRMVCATVADTPTRVPVDEALRIVRAATELGWAPDQDPFNLIALDGTTGELVGFAVGVPDNLAPAAAAIG